jgi:hypothetical protein
MVSNHTEPRFEIHTTEFKDDYGGFLVDSTEGAEYFIPGPQVFVKKERYDSWRKTLLS